MALAPAHTAPMTEQIEAEVVEVDVPLAEVPKRELWEVWYVEALADEHRWYRSGTYDNKATADATVARDALAGIHTRIVHYVLPALTIKAKEN